MSHPKIKLVVLRKLMPIWKAVVVPTLETVIPRNRPFQEFGVLGGTLQIHAQVG